MVINHGYKPWLKTMVINHVEKNIDHGQKPWLTMVFDHGFNIFSQMGPQSTMVFTKNLS